jgi:hypothetical protein
MATGLNLFTGIFQSFHPEMDRATAEARITADVSSRTPIFRPGSDKNSRAVTFWRLGMPKNSRFYLVEGSGGPPPGAVTVESIRESLYQIPPTGGKRRKTHRKHKSHRKHKTHRKH